LTEVNIITEDRMPRNKYFYENRLFTNKVRHNTILGGKEKALRGKKKRVTLIKSFIYTRVEDTFGGECYKRLIKVDHIVS